MRMEMPLVVGQSIRRGLMKAHGIGKGYVEEPIVAAGESLEKIGQSIPFAVVKLLQGSEMALADHKRFEWPHGPKRNHGCKELIFIHQALSGG